MYSYRAELTDGQGGVKIKNNKTAKGIKKNVIKRDLDHSHYLACLQYNTVEQHKMRTIRSRRI